MDKSQQPRGDFYAPLSPIFQGQLSKPGDEAKLPFALWAFKYPDRKTGELKTGYAGGINGVPANIPAQDQIDALLAEPSGTDAHLANLNLRPGQIVLFVNGFRDEAPVKTGR